MMDPNTYIIRKDCNSFMNDVLLHVRKLTRFSDFLLSIDGSDIIFYSLESSKSGAGRVGSIEMRNAAVDWVDGLHLRKDIKFEHGEMLKLLKTMDDEERCQSKSLTEILDI